MFNHRDVLQTSSWHAHVRGTKRWHLCDPAQSHSMYKAGDVDVFVPDYEKFPNFLQAHCTEDDVTVKKKKKTKTNMQKKPFFFFFHLLVKKKENSPNSKNL